MKLVLITGKSGSGKNKLSELLCLKTGFKHIDIDKICHTIYEDEKLLKNVVKEFGEFILENGKINRKKLGQIVFNDKSKMEKLTCLTYDYVIEKIDNIINSTNEVCVLNYALLPNTKYWLTDFPKILCKSLNEEERLNNLMERDNLSKEYLLARDKNSLIFNEKEFDFVFENDYLDTSLNIIIDKIIDLVEKKL